MRVFINPSLMEQDLGTDREMIFSFVDFKNGSFYLDFFRSRKEMILKCSPKGSTVEQSDSQVENCGTQIKPSPKV